MNYADTLEELIQKRSADNQARYKEVEQEKKELNKRFLQRMQPIVDVLADVKGRYESKVFVFGLDGVARAFEVAPKDPYAAERRKILITEGPGIVKMFFHHAAEEDEVVTRERPEELIPDLLSAITNMCIRGV